jgi:hypothetical protein
LAQIDPRALWDWLLCGISRNRESIGKCFLRADAANRGEQYRKDGAN